ncbi:MAG: lysophospholipid acyltransferase family protein [Bacteroidetes bacterium]|nr:lysophospholipid acyltransferase family protein [Bacteroidota bacterium]
MIDKKLAYKDKRYYESFLKKTANALLVVLLIGISHLPFWILYRISDFFYVLLRYIFKYRKKVITENLTHAFPEKSDVEIKQIMGKFYLHFCDMFVETIKGYSASEKQMRKRVTYNKIDEILQYHAEGRSLVLFGMHYNNWEWGNFTPQITKHDVVLLYNPMRGNQAFDRFINKTRTRWGATTIPVNRASRVVLGFGKANKPSAIWLGADQSAPPTSKFWTTFFNREAPFFSGPEKIAHLSNQPVFLHVTRKVKRGHYVVDFIPLFDKPKEVEPKDIMLAYIRKMEEEISKKPAYYLWSHRRWKHKRPEDISLTL